MAPWSVTAKLLYCPRRSINIPVWEIRSNGNVVYYELVHREGYIPIGVTSRIQYDGSTILSYKSAGKLTDKTRILLVKDGYTASPSWYIRDSCSPEEQAEVIPNEIDIPGDSPSTGDDSH